MSSSSPIRVFSVDDHPLLREGIGALVNNQPDMVLVGEAATGAEAIQLFKQHVPDVTLMDLRLPDMSGIDTLIAIRTEFPEARIIMLTTFEGDVEIQRALQAGARGYLLKNMPPSELLDVIRQVHAGKKRIPPAIASQLAEHMTDETLTVREIEVLREVADFEARRATLQQRVALIDELRRGQSAPVHMVDQISRALPEMTWLTSMKQDGYDVTIEGRCLNLTALSDFIGNLEASRYFKRPVEIIDSAVVPGAQQQGTQTTPDLIRFVVKGTFQMAGIDAKPATPRPAGRGGN